MAQNPPPALLGLQDGQRAQRLAEIRPRQGQSGVAGNLDGGDPETQAGKAFDRFARDFGAKYPKAVAILDKDRAALLAFYDFPAEHWVHIRTTNPIESSFATIRHRTTRTKNCVSRNTLLGLVFQLALTAEQSWRKLGGFKRLPDVLNGVRFQDGIAVVDPPDAGEDEPQKIAA